MITYTFGISEDLYYRYIAIGLLITIGLIVSLSPVVYQSIEKIEMVLVSIILIFLVFAILIASEGSVWAGAITGAPKGIANFPQYASQIGAATLLGAIAFAGAGGANNLVQSNYVRDKGLNIIGLLSLIALSVLAFSTLGIQENVTADLTFLREEGNVLADVIAPWFATFFFAAASIKLFSTNLGILDWVSRLTADSLKVSF